MWQTTRLTLRAAWRALWARPWLTMAAAACLTLGIAANTVIFSLLNGVFLRPFPYRDPTTLVAIRNSVASRGITDNEVSYFDYAAWREGARSIVEMGLFFERSYSLAADPAADVEQHDGAALTASVFPTLGVPPTLGRGFTEDEDRPGGPLVVVLSDGLWRDAFGSDSSIVGRTIQVTGRPHTVVGVMPPGFAFPARATLWTPAALDRETERGNHFAEVIGRLRPGATTAELSDELNAVSRRLGELHPETNAVWGADVVSLREHEVGTYASIAVVLQAAVLVVLLIACVNVANLLLARGVSRRREFAVRTSLGADRRHLLLQLLAEALLLSLVSGLAAVVLAWWGVDLVAGLLPDILPFWMTFTVDSRVLIFTLLVSLITALLAGVVPAFRSSAINLMVSLRDGGRGHSAGPGNRRLRDALVVAEVGLSVVLLVGAGLMLRSSYALTRTDPGFRTDRALTAFLSLRHPSFDSLFERSRAVDRVLERVHAIPGVTDATMVSQVPLNGNNSSTGIFADTEVRQAGNEHPVDFRAVSPNFFSTLEIPFARGRSFTQREVEDSAAVVVVSASLATRIFGTLEVLGRRIIMGGVGDEAYAVVGVVQDVHVRTLREIARPQMYFPYTRSPSRVVNLVVTTAADPRQTASALRAAAREVAPSAAVFQLASLREVYDASVWQERLYSRLLLGFAGIALVLAALGVYGVVAYAASQRTQEIGVRVALGARRGDVRWLVVRDGLALGLGGSVLGAVGAVAAGGALRGLLYGVSPTDPLILVGVPLLLTLVAMAASLLPAHRASRTDPIAALREEA
jgi:putative ABC transport system permease protein